MPALLFCAYCLGNIFGPHFFRKDEAPHYSTAFRAIMVCYSLVVVLALSLRFYLRWLNAKRTIEEGFEGSASSAGALASGKTPEVSGGKDVAQAVTEVQLRPEDYDDVTDWNTIGFRYRM